MQRQDWFYHQRAYPLAHIPTGARLNALRQLDDMLAQQAASGDILAASATTGWQLIGPEPTHTPYNDPTVAGRIAALAVDPTNSNVVYAGAAEGGVWKSTDAGAHWTPLTDSQPSLAVGSMTIDPNNHLTIYVGTGEENFSGDSYYGAGILKSANGGTSWTQIKGPFVGPFNSDGYYGGGARIGAVAVQPGNSQVILVSVEMFSNPAGPNGIYRTTDGGTTWNAVLASTVGTDVLFDPTNATVAYAALGNIFGSSSNSVYKSTDSGATWTRIDGTTPNVLPTTNVGRIALAAGSVSGKTVLYAGVEDLSTTDNNNQGLLGLFKTTDGGTNWTKLTATPNYCTPQCGYDNVIGVQPGNGDVLFVGGAFGGGTQSVWRSTDGGQTWTNVSQAGTNPTTYLHADQHAFAFTANGATVYNGNDGGIWNSTTVTTTPMTWNQLNNTLAITQFTHSNPSINPNDVTNAFGGTQDNGTQKYSGTLVWNNVVCGDGGQTQMDPATTSNIYTICEGDSLIKKSTTGGAAGSWTAVTMGINSDRKQFYPPLALDPTHPLNLYFGSYRVYQTINGAANWAAISGDLTNNSASANVTALAVAPSNSNYVYAGTGNSLVQVTTNALSGASAVWTNVSAGLPPRFVTQVAVAPSSPSTAFVTFSGFSGFNGDTKGHVFKTTNTGASWADISGNLPNVPVNDFAIDPVLANTYYVATDIGVFSTANGGGKWSPLSSGLPRVVVLGLKIHSATRTLLAATHGRSMWDVHLPVADLTLSGTESPNPVASGAQLTYNFSVVNNGGDSSTSTTFTDAVPAGTTFVSASTSVGTCTVPAVGGTGTVSCKLGTMAKGATATLSLVVKDTAASGSVIKDTAKVSSKTPDPVTSNNSVTFSTNVH